MKLSNEERREVYLKALAEFVPHSRNYICNHLGTVGRLWPNSDNYPEFFLFKESHGFAWLSHQCTESGICDLDKINEVKEICLLLCAEMCNP